jgi:hypothetical protein
VIWQLPTFTTTYEKFETLTVFTIGISACVKSPTDKYVKESLNLEFKPNTNGTSTLYWSLVNDKELLHYEIFCADNDTFGVHNSTGNIIGVVKDRNVTSFDLSEADIQADTVKCPAKHYYKVAAVYKDRKVVSKTLEGPKAYLLAMRSGDITLAFDQHPVMYFRTTTNLGGMQANRINLETGAFIKNFNWPFARTLNSGNMQPFYCLGTSAQGEVLLAEHSSSPVNVIKFYNPENSQYIREIPLFGMSTVYNIRLVNGVIFAAANSSNQQLHLYSIDAATGNTIGSIPISASISSPRITVSNDGQTIIIHSTQISSSTPQVFQYQNGMFNILGSLPFTSNTNNIEDLSLSSDAGTILRAPARKIYNKNGTLKAQIDVVIGTIPKSFVLSDNARFIFYDGIESFSLRNCTDGSLIKEISIPFKKANLISVKPIVIKDKLYVLGQVFINQGNSVAITKAVLY